jgi:hypothetical protein
MRTKAGWAVIAALAMLTAAMLPGAGFAVVSLTPVTNHATAGATATITSVTSSNWAGYAALGSKGTVTKVTGTWVEPNVSCSSGRTTDVATWVGIDGYSTSDLVQTGASGDCSGTTLSYYAWWEILPAPETTISSFNVHAGDKITASVAYSTSAGKFTMKITDGTQSFSKTRSVASTARNSAECVVERDSVGGTLNHFSKFKADRFSSCTAAIGGASGGIGSLATVSKINMYNGATLLASTGALTSNKAFTVTWKAYG